jgi:hypothetical protein
MLLLGAVVMLLLLLVLGSLVLLLLLLLVLGPLVLLLLLLGLMLLLLGLPLLLLGMVGSCSCSWPCWIGGSTRAILQVLNFRVLIPGSLDRSHMI